MWVLKIFPNVKTVAREDSNVIRIYSLLSLTSKSLRWYIIFHWKWKSRSVSLLSKMNEAAIKWSERLPMKYSWRSFCLYPVTLLGVYFFFLSFKWVFDFCILIGSGSVYPEQNSTLAICSNSWNHQPFA